jgi:hypothetical protein
MSCVPLCFLMELISLSKKKEEYDDDDEEKKQDQPQKRNKKCNFAYLRIHL